MKNDKVLVVINSIRGKVLAASAAMCLTAVSEGRAGTFFSDFNFGLPSGASVYGTAFVDSTGGIADSGVLKLTQAFSYGSQGSFVIGDIDGGAPITGFTATFKLLVGGGEGADGLSFNFASDLPDDSFGEEGAGSGLTVSFDTFNNGGGEAPAIDVKYRGVTVASTKGIGDFFRTGDFVDVRIHVAAEGLVDVQVGSSVIYTNLLVGFAPASGRFGLGARTGALTDNHWVDDLSITTGFELSAHPFVRSAAPQGTAVRADAVVVIGIEDGATTQLDRTSVRLAVNGTAVAPVVSKAGNLTTIQYDPPGLLPPGSANSVSLTFADNGRPALTRSFSFVFRVPDYIGPTGNFYEFVTAPAIPWEDAKAAAEQRTFCGRPGHLVTITSADEDFYLENLRQEYVIGSAFAGEAWAGGFQLPDQPSPKEGWTWVNGEGPITGANGSAAYSNWFPGEPNDCCVTLYFEDNEENFLGIGLFGGLGWNDDGDGHLVNIGGYVVEYERLIVPVDIKPGSADNVVDLKSAGRLPVAILTTPQLDATQIDVATIRFGRAGIEAAPVGYSLNDVNKDGQRDLLLHFVLQNTGLVCNDKEAILRADTKGGCPVGGKDSVRIIGCPPYELFAGMALQDVNKNTDLELRVVSVLDGYRPPLESPHVQLKSFDLLGRLAWTRNLDHLTLSLISPTTSAATVRVEQTQAHQPIQIQMQVPNSRDGRTEVLRSQTTVLLRPDLTVEKVELPAGATACQIVNVVATLRELNGDLGANATVYLMDGESVVDSAYRVWVPPRGTADIFFAHLFDQGGTHDLRVVIGDTAPGDYDSANNRADASIDISAAPVSPVFYNASYWKQDQEYQREFDNEFFNSFESQRSQAESFNQVVSLGLALTFPLQQVVVRLAADGVEKASYEFLDLPADVTFGGGDSTYSSVWKQLDAQSYLAINSFENPGSCFDATHLSLFKSAADRVYRSVFHDKFYGTTDQVEVADAYGSFLDGNTSVESRIILVDEVGAFGGTAAIPISCNPIGNEWNDVCDTGYDRGFLRGTECFGSNSGVLTP